MGSPQIPYGYDGFQMWRVESKFPNMQSLVGNKGGSPACKLERSQTVFRIMKPKYYRRYTGNWADTLVRNMDRGFRNKEIGWKGVNWAYLCQEPKTGSCETAVHDLFQFRTQPDKRSPG
jgi:hypothetical protein